jgi:hypothetical protein
VIHFLPFWKRRKVTNTQPGNGLLGAVIGEVFHAGADLYAPAHKATDPAISLTGTGYIPQFYGLNPLQPPPLRAVMVAGQTGLGGPQAGTFYSAPLVDPDTFAIE